MCGIWFSAGHRPPIDVIASVAHRGPDGQGWKEFSCVAGTAVLAHRRLAIIDLTDDAIQPMSSADERIWITFNGEIYNYIELREELRRLGHVFRTASDTEVILASYAEWGEDCLEHLYGMFALVVFDRERGRVFAARDRFGIKPLYWYMGPGGISFGSEIKQFTYLPGFSARMNRARVYDFLVGPMMDHSADTMFAGVHQVRAGHYVSFDLAEWLRTRCVEQRRWYRIPEPESLDISLADAVDLFRDAFEESVRIHLRADVTVGACLSGGLDSSSIVCLMARFLREQRAENHILTVSSCFEEKSVDEQPFIQTVVKHAGVGSAYTFPQWSDLPGQIEKLTWHQDEPFGSTSIFAQWCVFRKAKELGLTVMLDGQGADEQLAGYHGVFETYLPTLVAEKRYVELAQTILGRKRFHQKPIAQQLVSVLGARAPEILRRIANRGSVPTTRDSLLSPEAWQEADLTKPPYLAAMERDGLSSLATIGQLCEAMTMTTNLCQLLHFEDRNSMAHSVEARVPFLDHRVVDVSIGIGSKYKIKGTQTKLILRRAMAKVLPPKVLHRKDKLGFSTPEEIWFKGPLRGAVQQWVEDAIGLYPDLLDVAGVRRMVADTIEGRRPFSSTVWRIASLGLWGKVFRVSA